MAYRKPGWLIAGSVALLLLVAGCSAQKIEVTFDGDGCSFSGTSEIEAGELTAVFIDHSDMSAELWLLNMDEGYTLQDHLNGQSEPGEWYPKPTWVHYDRRVSLNVEESNGQRVTTSVWELDKVGEHTIACYVPSPEMMWFIGPLWVIESAAD